MKDLLKQYNNLKKVFLIRLERPESTPEAPVYLYYTDFNRDITYNSITYKTNAIKTLNNIKFTRELTAHKINVTFSGLDDEQLGIALDESSSFLNKSLRIILVYLDPVTENIIGEAIVVFEGLITNSGISESSSGTKLTSSIKWECANHFQDFQQVVGRITDDYDHRGMVVENGEWVPSLATKRPEYALDKGFYHANKSTSIIAKYQTEETKYKLKKKSSWFGLKKSISLQEYKEVVTKEVDLRFDLSAKFIPVVYGVQKVPAIPIFADTEAHDPSSVWVVYAICEGEIEGFYDFYLDDNPIICLTDDDSDSRVCFGRKKINGDTINNSVAGSDGNPASGRAAVSEHGREYVMDDGAGEVRFWTFHGKSNQEAAQVLVDIAAANNFYLQNLNGDGPEYWDDTFKLLDTAYVIFNFKLSDLDGGRTAIPTIEAEVRGKIVNISENGNIIYTNGTSLNMAWQLLDYITSFRYGMSINYSEIDLHSFEDVANKFNAIDTTYNKDWVPFWRYLGWNAQDDSFKTVMQTNVLIETEQAVFKNVAALLNQVNCSLNKYSGKYILKVESDDPIVASINLDKEAIKPIEISDLTGSSKYNTVTGSIADPGKAWATNSITFYNSQYKEEDRGIEKKLNLSFPYVTNYYTARSMIERELTKSRFSRSVSATLPFYYIGEFLPNDNVSLTYSRYDWVDKRFIVDSIEILYNGKLNVTFLEFPPDVFINSGQADVSNEQNPIGNVSILPPRDLQYKPSVDMDNPGANINGILSWLPSLSNNTSYYSVYWTNAPGIVMVPKENVDETGRIFFEIDDLTVGTYVFTVRAVSTTGSFSSPISIEISIDPSKYLPDVINFRVINLEPGYSNQFIYNYVELQWDPIVTEVQNIQYRIQILNNTNTVIREITTINSSYIYNYTDNKTDYSNLTGELGAFRELRFKIRAEGDGNSQSLNWSQIT
jgi:hypothetical protein